MLVEISAHKAAVQSVPGDASDPAQADALVSRAADRFEKSDFAFDNAGVAQMFGFTLDTLVEEWRRINDIDLPSVFYGMKARIAAMQASGGGAIVNNSSDTGSRVVPGIAVYDTARRGIVAWTEAVARKGGADAIRGNAVCPGAADTPTMHRFTPGDPASVAESNKGIPPGAADTPDDVASTVMW